jgi:hypothetical protein
VHPALCQLENLNELSLTYTLLADLPPELGVLTLKSSLPPLRFSFSRCCVVSRFATLLAPAPPAPLACLCVSPVCLSERCTQLRVIWLNFCAFTAVPEVLLRLPQLEVGPLCLPQTLWRSLLLLSESHFA